MILYCRHISKNLIYSISFYLHKDPVIVSTFYMRSAEAHKGCWPKTTQLVTARVET
jgi:hypothetical protein